MSGWALANESIPLELSAALGRESFDPELMTEGLGAERLGPNGASESFGWPKEKYVNVLANRST